MFSVLALAIIGVTGSFMMILQNGGIESGVNFKFSIKAPDETININVTLSDPSGKTKNLLIQMSGSRASLAALVPDLIETTIQEMLLQQKGTTDSPRYPSNFTLTDFIFQKAAIVQQKQDGALIALWVVRILGVLLLIPVFYFENKHRWTSNRKEKPVEYAPASTTSSTENSFTSG